MQLEDQTEGDGGAEVIDAPEAQTTSERDWNAEAAEMGWRPKGEFPGDEGKFVDAKTYVLRGETMLPMVKAELAKAKGQIAELKKTFKQFGEYHNKVEERAYTRALSELQGKLDDAVEVGDVLAARKANKEITDLVAETRARVETPAVEEDHAEDRKAILGWIRETGWYGSDTSKTTYADLEADDMGPAHAWDGGTEAWLTELQSRVERKFAPAKVNPVNGGGNRSAVGKTGKGYADLPAEDRKICDKFVAAGILTRDEYLKRYEF